MDLVTGQRTFCLGLSANTTVDTSQVWDVPFVDSAGNVMKCNYVDVSVQADDAAAIGILAFELSGLVTEGNAVLDGLSSISTITTPNASGICGFNMVLGATTNSLIYDAGV